MDPLTAMLNARKANVRAPGRIQNFGAQDMASILQQQQLNRGSIGARLDGPAPTMVKQDPYAYADRKEARDFQVLDAIQARRDAAQRQAASDQAAMIRQKMADANALARQKLSDQNALNRLELADEKAIALQKAANEKALALEALRKQNAFAQSIFDSEQDAKNQREQIARQTQAKIDEQARIDKQFAGLKPALSKSIAQWTAWGSGSGDGSRNEFYKKSLNESFDTLAAASYTQQEVQDAYVKKLTDEGKKVPKGFVLKGNDPNYMETVKDLIRGDEQRFRQILSAAQRQANQLTNERGTIISQTFGRTMDFVNRTGVSFPGTNSLTASVAPPPSGTGSPGLPQELDPGVLFKRDKPDPNPNPGAEVDPLVPQYQRDASVLADLTGRVADAITNGDVSASDFVTWAIGAGIITGFKDLGKLNSKDVEKLVNQFKTEVADITSTSRTGKPLNKTNTQRKLESHWKNGKFDAYMKELGAKHGVEFTDEDLEEYRKRGVKGRKNIPQDFVDALEKKKGGWIKQLSRKTYNGIFPVDPKTGKRIKNPFQGGVPDTTTGRLARGGAWATAILAGKDIFDWILAENPEDAKKDEELLKKVAGVERMQADHEEMVEVIDINESSAYARSQIEALRSELSGGSESPTALTPQDAIAVPGMSIITKDGRTIDKYTIGQLFEDAISKGKDRETFGKELIERFGLDVTQLFPPR